jgi:hypothetical protein
MLFLLPGGEGQDEGERFNHSHLESVRAGGAETQRELLRFSLRLGATDYKPNQNRTAASSFTKSVSSN